MTLVVQSHPPDAPGWVRRCVATVGAWAAGNGFDHEVVGDELLDLAPRDIGRLPATDLARLRLLRDRLDRGCDRVVWLDADVVVFAPERVSVPATFAVCEEVWMTPGRTLHLVCNAALVAVAGDDRLDEVLGETERRAAAAEGELHERALGPDLVTALHRRRPFALVPGVVLVSPLVVSDVAEGRPTLVDGYGAVNLCGSMADQPFDAALDRLLGLR